MFYRWLTCKLDHSIKLNELSLSNYPASFMILICFSIFRYLANMRRDRVFVFRETSNPNDLPFNLIGFFHHFSGKLCILYCFWIFSLDVILSLTPTHRYFFHVFIKRTPTHFNAGLWLDFTFATQHTHIVHRIVQFYYVSMFQCFMFRQLDIHAVGKLIYYSLILQSRNGKNGGSSNNNNNNESDNSDCHGRPYIDTCAWHVRRLRPNGMKSCTRKNRYYADKTACEQQQQHGIEREWASTASM